MAHLPLLTQFLKRSTHQINSIDCMKCIQNVEQLVHQLQSSGVLKLVKGLGQTTEGKRTLQ
jgi:hypothetical protein